MKIKKNNKGFTFIELMFAIALFGINFHLIYGQVSQSIRSISLLKKRQNLYFQIQNHVQDQLNQPYEYILNSNIRLSNDLSHFRAKQVVQIIQSGLKSVKIEVVDSTTSIAVLSLNFLKADQQRKVKS
ncbi:MAG: prepilin-type N-terminal cleavage/methylation domain-containing protein [Candidatus Cloacimonetes bacterium]|nr:prepilin-type N-terminal cleavage/methylation domain-containing protein [Candidatus Cloacimonadota bacterium]